MLLPDFLSSNFLNSKCVYRANGDFTCNDDDNDDGYNKGYNNEYESLYEGFANPTAPQSGTPITKTNPKTKAAGPKTKMDMERDRIRRENRASIKAARMAKRRQQTKDANTPSVQIISSLSGNVRFARYVIVNKGKDTRFFLPVDGVPCARIKNNNIPDKVDSLINDKVASFKKVLVPSFDASGYIRNMLSTFQTNAENPMLFVFVTLTDAEGKKVPAPNNKYKITYEHITKPDPFDPKKGTTSLLERYIQGVQEGSNGRNRITKTEFVNVTMPVASKEKEYDFSSLNMTENDIIKFAMATNALPQVDAFRKQYVKDGKLLTLKSFPPMTAIVLSTTISNVKWVGMGHMNSNLEGATYSWFIMNTDHPQTFIHEFGHTNGLFHPESRITGPNPTLKVKDESCFMGSADVAWEYNAANSYVAGYLNRVDYVDLTEFAPGKTYEFSVPLSKDHGLILYLPVITISVPDKTYTAAQPMPYCVISYRQTSNPYNTKKNVRRVYVHGYNKNDPWLSQNDHDNTDAAPKNSDTPYVSLLGIIDNTTKTKDFDYTKPVAFDATLSGKLPWVIVPSLKIWEQMIYDKEISTLATALGFKNNQRPTVPSFTVKVISMTDTDARIAIVT